MSYIKQVIMCHTSRQLIGFRRSLDHTPTYIDDPKVNSALKTTSMCSRSVGIYRPRIKTTYFKLCILQGYLLYRERQLIKMSMAWAYQAHSCQGIVTAKFKLVFDAKNPLAVIRLWILVACRRDTGNQRNNFMNSIISL